MEKEMATHSSSLLILSKDLRIPGLIQFYQQTSKRRAFGLQGDIKVKGQSLQLRNSMGIRK